MPPDHSRFSLPLFAECKPFFHIIEQFLCQPPAKAAVVGVGVVYSHQGWLTIAVDTDWRAFPTVWQFLLIKLLKYTDNGIISWEHPFINAGNQRFPISRHQENIHPGFPS